MGKPNKAFWDARYGESQYAYGKLPNVFFANWLKDRPSGSILLPCDGEGRNAVFAASLGWNVTATDHSTEGRDKALALAQEHSVDIRFEVEDVLKANWPDDHYDVIALCFVHFPEPERQFIHAACIRALKPGGQLILEAFSKDQIGHVSGGPRAVPILYSLEEMRSDFAPLHIESLTSEDVDLDEGKYHQGLASVVRLIASKPS